MAASAAPSSARRWLVRGAAAGLAVSVLYAALCVAVLHGEVTAASLSRSLDGAVDVGSHIYDDDSYGCTPSRRGGPGAWSCVVPSADSGVVGYRVVVEDGGSCWEAQVVSSDPEVISGMPKRASGCVRRLQLGL